MYQQYLNIAIRNLLKYKAFSSINLFGLTIGAACCLYILLYVQDQYSYDDHYDGTKGLVVRVTSDLKNADAPDISRMATSSPPIAPALQAEFPEVECAARVCSPPGVEQNLIRVGKRVFFERKGVYADSTLFRVLEYHFVAGDPLHALDAPYSVVLSENLAKKLFDIANPLDQTIQIGGPNGEQAFTVTGVFNDDLGKSHLMPAFFMAMNSDAMGQFVRNDDSWAGNNFIYSYLRLKPGVDPQALEAKIPAFLHRHGADQLAQLHMKKTLRLQPVSAIHTTAGYEAELSPVTSQRFLNMLLLIAGFILVVACINFMNLTTARSARRAQEVGVRKTVGAPRSALVFQFLSESMVLAFLAVGLAAPLVAFALPVLNRLTGADIAFDIVENQSSLAMTGALVALTGLLAGSYPAFYLSSFRPVAAFRGATNARGQFWLRKSLVVTQFIISITLIIGAIVIRSQLHFMLDQDLGFEKNQKLVFPFRTPESQQQLGAFQNELQKLPEVRSTSGMLVCPGQMVFHDINLYKEGQSMEQATNVRCTFTDENYLNTLKIKLLAGRFLTASDTATAFGIGNVVINEETLRRLNITSEQAVGTVLRSDFRDRHFRFTIIGVMQDFCFQSMTSKIDPFMVSAGKPGDLAQLVADVQASDYTVFLSKAEKAWRAVIPDLPFEYSFLDQDFAKIYQSEQTLSRIIGAFTLMAILISCLGLLGLSMFTAEQRAKEIGIRKVLGATSANLLKLLSADFIQLILVALVLASPIAWFILNAWLQEFAYRTQIGWWMFALAGATAFTAAIVTISIQSIKAALANPVHSLRNE